MTNASKENIQDEESAERELSDLEKLGVIQMDLMDIKRQQKFLYISQKQKEEEADEIWKKLLNEAKKGKTIFDKEE